MPNINVGLEKFRTVPNAVLLDIRASREYKEGHVPGSVNLPLDRIGQIDTVAEDFNTPLFVYCYSGTRSAQAVSVLRIIGYTNVEDIGGMSDYQGTIEL